MTTQRDGTFQRIQLGPARTLFALRVSEDDEGDRSCLYRIVIADDPSQPPEVEVLMDFAGWLTDFWRAEDKTFFLGTVDGDVFILGTEGSREYALESGGIAQIFARSVDDVCVATTSGALLRWNGDTWASMGPAAVGSPRPGSVCGLHAIGGLADGRVVAVGERGRILVQDGSSWQSVEAPSNNALTAIGTMQGATYIGGEGGVCYRLQPDLTLVPVPGPTYGTFGFVSYRGRGYSASQAAGLMILKDEGTDAEKLETFARPLQPYGIAAQDDLLVVHSEDSLAWFDGATWHALDIDVG